jgi:hypothetical protein
MVKMGRSQAPAGAAAPLALQPRLFMDNSVSPHGSGVSRAGGEGARGRGCLAAAAAAAAVHECPDTQHFAACAGYFAVQRTSRHG